MGLAGARGFLSLVYAQGGDRYGDSLSLHLRISCALHPTVWSAPVPVNQVRAARGTSATAARLVHCLGAPDPFPFVFFCGYSEDGPRGLYCSTPRFGLGPDAARGPDNAAPSSRPRVMTGRICDASGRSVGRVSFSLSSPSVRRVPTLAPGVYFVLNDNGGDGVTRLTIVR
jgi:hypothetical protein